MSYNLQHLLSTVLRNRAVALPPANKFAGAWGIRSPWLDGSTVLDQRTGLGTPRPPEPRRCLEFNGTDQYGWIDVDTVNYPFTIFGFSISDLTNTRWLVSLSDPSSSTRYFTFGYNNGDLITIGRRNTTETLDSQAVDLVNGWVSYVVCFVDATTVEVYRNGILLHTFSGITSVPAGAGLTRFAVGTFRTASPAGNWDGRAMHCGFLRRAATLADAQTFHTTGIIPDAEVLLPLDSNSTTVAHNIGTSAAHWLDEPRRNLLQYTENLDNPTFWVLRRITEDTVFTNPSGNQAITIRDTTENGTHGPYHIPTVAAASGQLLTFSLVAQAGTSSVLGLAINQSNESSAGILEASFNVTTGEVLSGPGTITPLGAGWYKCTVSGTVNVTGVFRGFVYMYNSEGVRTYIGTELNTITISEPQLEFGSTATEYQPVLGSGIDYPEATIVNGAAGMLYEGRDVPFSRQNEVGFSERKNLLERTQNFASAYWTKNNSTVTGGLPDPFGGTGAWKVAETDTTAGFNVARDGLGTLTTRSGSVYVKSAERQYATLLLSNATNASVVFSLIDGSIQFAGNMLYNISIVDVGNGWWKVSASINVPDTPFQSVFRVGPSDGTSPPYAGVSGNGIFIFGPHLVDGTAITPYQRIDSNPGTNVRIPALLSDPTKSAATDPLTYTGKAHFDGTLEQSNCLTFDGVDDYISMDLADVAGPELVTNGDFSDGTTGWSTISGSTINVNGSGQLEIATGSQAISLNGSIATEPGSVYLLSVDVISLSVGSQGIILGSTTIGSDVFSGITTGTGKRTAIFTARSATTYISWSCGSAPRSAVIDNISVRELPETILGQELITNQTFDSDTTGWYVGANSSASVVNGEAQVTLGGALTSTSGNWFSSGVVVASGDLRKFRLEFDATWISGSGSLQVGTGYVVNRTIVPNAGKTKYVVEASGLYGGSGSGSHPNAIVFGSTSAGTVWAIDNVSVKQVGLIPHDGTSLLTYRPEGDGINGTAGTAYNIRLGDVEHIPCSEGAGDFVHGTKLNQAYPIVNGQASNWETKQDNYNYNITKGATKIDTSVSENFDPSTLVLSSETSIGIDPSDFTHLFQDHRGTVPVTQVGDPIGLAIDKQQGGLNNPGPELVTNGGFDTSDGWALVQHASILSGQGVFNNTTDVNSRIARQLNIPVNKTVVVEFDLVSTTSGGLPYVQLSPTASVGASGFVSILPTNFGARETGRLRGVITNTTGTSTPWIIFATAAATGAQAVIDNVSVREIPGYHISQTDNAKRPILARTPEGGPRQLLQWSEDLTNSAWSKTRLSVVGNATPALGTGQAQKLVENTDDDDHFVNQSGLLPSGRYLVSIEAKAGERTWVVVTINGFAQGARFNLANGEIGTVTGTGASASIEDLGDGWYRCSYEGNRTAGSFGPLIHIALDDSTLSYAGDGTSGLYVNRCLFQLVAEDTNYQKSTTLFDITEAGKRDCWAIGFPGNAALSTPASVDMSGSDEMVVCAGVRKLSDAARGILCEFGNLGTPTSGSFAIDAPAFPPGSLYRLQSSGSSVAAPSSGDAAYTAPHTASLVGIGKISSDTCQLQINGETVSSSADQGSGNYGNHRIYFGARTGSSLYFNGLMYSCVIINRLLTEFERERLENWSAYKQGAANFHIIEPLFNPASQTSPGFDSLENPLTNPAIIGHNGAETEINFSPVDNSWPEQYSIPGADLPNYTFDGDPGDIVVRVDTPTREGSFRLEK